MSSVTYTSPSQSYAYTSSSGWYVQNDAWGTGNLVDGVDYSISATFDPSNFQSGVTFSWTFPANVGGVYAYPHIDFDASSATVSTTQSANIANLSANYNVNLTNTANSTVAFDFWFNSAPNGPFSTTDAELLVEVHATSPGTPNTPFVLSGSGFTGATVYASNASGGGANWEFIDVKMPTDIMSGTLSISDIIKGLIWDGLLTGKEYFSSLQFGSEVHGGTGSLQINSLAYNWTANPTLVGTAGNDTFTITNSGGNDIVGNGGSDTVVYAGSYANYQIKSVGSEVLVTNNNNISTLDELQGITFIKFSDETYNTATGSFAAAAAAAVSSVVASGSGITNDSGDLNAGHVVTLTVNLSEAVTVAGGTPTLTLNDGGTATYTSGSGSNALTFSYTVAAGQNTPNLAVTAVNLNSATVADTTGNAANLTGASTALNVTIDTVAPTAPIIASYTDATATTLTVTGTAEANSTVNLYEGSALLGTALTSASGTWNITTGPLSTGAHDFVATATDVAGNVSPNSTLFDPVVGSPSGTSSPPTLVSFSHAIELTGDALSVAELYVGYFNRSPDAVGLSFWLAALNSGVSVSTIANEFANSQEALSKLPSLSTVVDATNAGSFVDSVYANFLDRAADAAGRAFWINELESGGVAPGSFILAIQAAVSHQSGTADVLTLLSKATAGIADSASVALTGSLTLVSAPTTIVSGAILGDTIVTHDSSALNITSLTSAQLSTIAASATLAAAIAAGSALTSGAHGVDAFQWEGNTYVVENVVAGTADSTSTVVEFVGVHTIGASSTAGAFMLLS
jgi:hypothetical protein